MKHIKLYNQFLNEEVEIENVQFQDAIKNPELILDMECVGDDTTYSKLKVKYLKKDTSSYFFTIVESNNIMTFKNGYVISLPFGQFIDNNGNMTDKPTTVNIYENDKQIKEIIVTIKFPNQKPY